ncbi:MAG: hypothetical protein AAGF94_20700 [Pseudomonadota bacterium]
MKKMIFLGVMLLVGCTALEPVAPSANQVAERLTIVDETPQQTQKWLLNRGFKQLQRNGYGGIWPKTGPCYQTEKGIRFRGQTVTRVCFAGDRDPAVFVRQTKGIYWSEVYPRDLSYNVYAPSGLGGISDETVELLKQ